MTIIDPTSKGNVGRFMSAFHFVTLRLGRRLTKFVDHACPPLANVLVISVRPVGSKPIAAMFAGRRIEAGEELLFDYSDAGGEEWYYGVERSRSEGPTMEGRTVCDCGSIRSVERARSGKKLIL